MLPDFPRRLFPLPPYRGTCILNTPHLPSDDTSFLFQLTNGNISDDVHTRLYIFAVNCSSLSAVPRHFISKSRMLTGSAPLLTGTPLSCSGAETLVAMMSPVSDKLQTAV